MSDDPLAEARAEAGRRYGRMQTTLISRARGAFLGGVEWEKSRSSSKPNTITREERNLVAGYLSTHMGHTVMESCVRAVDDALAIAGIEVTEDE